MLKIVVFWDVQWVPGVNWLGHVNVKVKNEWSYTSTTPPVTSWCAVELTLYQENFCLPRLPYKLSSTFLAHVSNYMDLLLFTAQCFCRQYLMLRCTMEIAYPMNCTTCSQNNKFKPLILNHMQYN